MKLIGSRSRDRTAVCAGRDLGAAVRAGDALGILQFRKGHGRKIRIAVIHKGLESVGRDGRGEQSQNQNGTADSADAPGKRAERSFPILADVQAGEPPETGQSPQPGKPHVGCGAEDPKIGKIIGQGPHAGIEPAKLPFIGPQRKAQTAKGGKEHQGQIHPVGELVKGGGCQEGQGKGQAHKNQVGQTVVCKIKD